MRLEDLLGEAGFPPGSRQEWLELATKSLAGRSFAETLLSFSDDGIPIDLCIVRDDAGITKENARELEGKKVATQLGNVTHYKLLKTLEHLGVDAAKVELVQMNPADAAVAMVRGDVVMGCAFGGALDRMKEVGKPLMTGAEQEAVGINTFDVIDLHRPGRCRRLSGETMEHRRRGAALRRRRHDGAARHRRTGASGSLPAAGDRSSWATRTRRTTASWGTRCWGAG